MPSFDGAGLRCLSRALVFLVAVAVATLFAMGQVSGSPEQASPPVDFDSTDLLVAAQGGPTGYQLFTAREDEGWAWRPLANIQPGGGDSDDWIGYHCLTGDGRYVIAVIAPRHFANSPVLRDRGGLAYIVTVADGTVRPLARGVAIKYHTPGCGRTNDAVLTRNLGSDQESTEVLVVDSERAVVARSFLVRSQLTNAVPDGDRVVALSGSAVVEAGPTGLRPIARVPGTAYMLRPAVDGFDLLTTDGGSTAEHWQIRNGGTRMALAGPRTTLRLYSGRGGRNVLVGPNGFARGARPGIAVATTPAAGQASGASLEGHAAFGLVTSRRGAAGHRAMAVGHTASAAPITIWRARGGARRAPLPGAAATFTRVPGRATAPAVAPRPGEQRANANTTTPTCAVPRNDLNRQVPQPNRQQIDWAIQQGTRNLLKGAVLTRPAGFLNLGLVAYQPSNDFARGTLAGSPNSVPVPPSVIQGTLAQESAWRHASMRALPGESGNPNINDYYGAHGTLDVIDYDAADCGYGVGQITDPMRISSPQYSANGKTKVAVDYAENVVASTQFLVDKWNQLYNAGVILNDGDPSRLENWYFAIWAYNSGFHANTGSGPWGLGWTNNPRNGDYFPGRSPFLATTYADAEHPADWPYQERVMGWMEVPLLNYRGQPSYAEPSDILDLPGHDQFCTAANECDPNWHDPSRPPGDISVDFCTRPDRRCWWHSPVTFANCAGGQCATSQFTYATTATEPAADEIHAPACSSTLGANAVIVDNQPSRVNVEGCTTANWTNAGTFTVSYGSTAGVPLGRIDWHQLGTGFGGHLWFTKNRASGDGAHINTGTWTPTGVSGFYNVKVHVPVAAASTSYATYTIYPTATTANPVTRTINQHLHQNRWVSLGNFNLSAGARVVLSNVTPETPGTANVAFDAVAFTPVSGTQVSATVDAFAVFDPDQNLDTNNDGPSHGSTFEPFNTQGNIIAWADGITASALASPLCSGALTISCLAPQTRAAYLAWRNQVVGTTAIPPAQWLGFANPRPFSGNLSAGYLDDPDNHKIRNQLRIEFLITNGQVNPGSVTVNSLAETGDTHLPAFVMAIMRAYRDDYGIPLPDMRYSAPDLSRYTHAVTTVDPRVDGVAPGRAYKPYISPAQIVGSGACVRVRTISGGTIGLKPMVLQEPVRAAVSAWVDAVESMVNAGAAPPAVLEGAKQIRRIFFQRPSLTPFTGDGNSPFYAAPPIWIQQDVELCGNGTVRPGDVNIADIGYMPDLYIYVNGLRTDQDGIPHNGPAAQGDFRRFANLASDVPLLGTDENPWRRCNFDTSDVEYNSRRDGSPWRLNSYSVDPSLQVIGPYDADETPTEVRLCDEADLPPGYHNTP